MWKEVCIYGKGREDMYRAYGGAGYRFNVGIDIADDILDEGKKRYED
jgi:hypothetical protein